MLICIFCENYTLTVAWEPKHKDQSIYWDMIYWLCQTSVIPMTCQNHNYALLVCRCHTMSYLCHAVYKAMSRQCHDNIALAFPCKKYNSRWQPQKMSRLLCVVKWCFLLNGGTIMEDPQMNCSLRYNGARIMWYYIVSHINNNDTMGA